MFERRLYHHIDWAMLTGVMALCLIGLAQIYSATGGFTIGDAPSRATLTAVIRPSGAM